MNETKGQGDGRPNRRKEIFRAVRGSTLTGQRGSWAGGPAPLAVAASTKLDTDDELRSVRRVRLGTVVEDEVDSAEPHDTRRYSEPND